MDIPQSGRTGILIVRLWIESNAVDGFRARVTHTADAADPIEHTSVAATPADLYQKVRSWVEAFVNPN